MLPDHVNIILLSATVPNTKEFADWVGYAPLLVAPTLLTDVIIIAQSNEAEGHLRHFYTETSCPARALFIRW